MAWYDHYMRSIVEVTESVESGAFPTEFGRAHPRDMFEIFSEETLVGEIEVNSNFLYR